MQGFFLKNKIRHRTCDGAFMRNTALCLYVFCSTFLFCKLLMFLSTVPLVNKNRLNRRLQCCKND